MNDQNEYQSHVHLFINDSNAPDEILDAIMSVRVEQGLWLPTLCLLRLQDDDLNLTDSPRFDIGSRLKVKMGSSNKMSVVFDGEVVGLELQSMAEGILTLVVRACDLAHRLQRGRHTRSFLNVTDSELAQRFADEAGLQHDIENTRQVHEYLLQDNRSNYEFLRQRAQRIGFELSVADGRLRFRRPNSSKSKPVSLEWGSTLQFFHPTASAGRQLDEVIVRGWNPQNKQAIIGQAAQGWTAVKTKDQCSGASIAQKAFGAARSMVVQQPVTTQAEAEALAQALLDELSSAYIQADGEADGNTDIAPGKALDIKFVGDRFSGTYHVTSAVHTISNRREYRTRFSASGSRAMTLIDLLQVEKEKRDWVCTAVVTNNRDPDGLGRVKVKLPWLGDETESTWARTVAPSAGSGRGVYFLPEVDDEVLVAFEQGDMRRAYVLGSLWNGVDPPPIGKDEVVDGQGHVLKRIIHSRSGHKILLDDNDQDPAVEIQDKHGGRIVLNKSGIEVVKKGQSLKVTPQKVTVNGGALEVI